MASRRKEAVLPTSAPSSNPVDLTSILDDSGNLIIDESDMLQVPADLRDSPYFHGEDHLKRLKGHKEPRLFTPPLRKLNRDTSLGFEVIDFARDVLGIRLFPWQQWVLIHALELKPGTHRSERQFRFRTVILLVARQNGKTTLLQVLALWRMFLDNSPLVIGTAQSLDFAEETWEGAVELAEAIPELSAEIKRVDKRNGKRALILQTGERYKVQAASRRGGRGFAGDLIMLDELREHQNWEAWGAITKTTMARPRPQIWGTSNAGDSASIVLRTLRDKALASEAHSSSIGLFEYSASDDRDRWDPEGWAEANPMLGHLIHVSAIMSAAETDPDYVFFPEVLCRWARTGKAGPFAKGKWEATTDEHSSLDQEAPLTFAIDTSVDRAYSHIAVAGIRDDDLYHIEIVATRSGSDWVPDWFKSRATPTKPMRVVVQARGAPSSPLIEKLKEVKNLTVIELGGEDLGKATALMFDKVNQGGMRHLPQPLLDTAAAQGVIRMLSEGIIVWDRKRSPVDIAPLVAANYAMYGVEKKGEKAKVSAYETRDLIIV